MELNGRLFLQVANFLRVLMFIFLSLYVLNTVGNLEAVQHWVGGRLYLNVLWIVMALYLLISRFDMDRDFFVRQFRLLAPIGAVCVFLYFFVTSMHSGKQCSKSAFMSCTALQLVNRTPSSK